MIPLPVSAQEHQSLLPAAHMGLWFSFPSCSWKCWWQQQGNGLLLNVSKGKGLFSQCELQPLLG